MLPPPLTGLFFSSRIGLVPHWLTRLLSPKNNDAPLIEDWESEGEDEVESPSEIERKTVEPSMDKARCKYHQRERMVNGTNHLRVNHSANRSHPGTQRNTVPKVVLTRTGLKPVNIVRHVNPKSTRRSFQRRTTYNNINFSQKVNTARPNSAVLNAVRANKGKGVKASACWDFRRRKLMSLFHVQGFDGGCVAFGGELNVGKITGNGINQNGKLDFDGCVLFKELILRKNNMYNVDMKNIVPKKDLTCLVVKATNDESMLWHRRLGHTNFKNINKLVKENLVRGLPSKFFENDQTCVACLKRKQHKVSFKSKIQNSITQPLFMLHVDLFGPTFAEAVNTACYVQNRVLVVKPHFKIPYELFRGRTPALSFMRPFGCHVTMLNTLDHPGKFDGKSDEGFFVGYSTTSKAFRVYNTRTRKVEENLHINFLENKPIIAGDGQKWLLTMML
ncbi:ribonuclease H-like domain-containing protein [Tanacetum coccineum]